MLLHGGTILHIDNALYSPKSHRNLLSFKDICLNGYHIETWDDRGIEWISLYYKTQFGHKMCNGKATGFII